MPHSALNAGRASCWSRSSRNETGTTRRHHGDLRRTARYDEEPWMSIILAHDGVRRFIGISCVPCRICTRGATGAIRRRGRRAEKA